MERNEVKKERQKKRPAKRKSASRAIPSSQGFSCLSPGNAFTTVDATQSGRGPMCAGIYDNGDGNPVSVIGYNLGYFQPVV
jgi:hypothetical protein